MAMLGNVLTAARRSASGVGRWLAGDHPGLLGAIGAAAAVGVSVGTLAPIAVADFGARASEEEWAGLTSRMRDCLDPGATCLQVTLEWRLARSAQAAFAQG